MIGATFAFLLALVVAVALVVYFVSRSTSAAAEKSEAVDRTLGEEEPVRRGGPDQPV
jgi:hypothetical protein